jgi:hypothetical protein
MIIMRVPTAAVLTAMELNGVVLGAGLTPGGRSPELHPTTTADAAIAALTESPLAKPGESGLVTSA